MHWHSDATLAHIAVCQISKGPTLYSSLIPFQEVGHRVPSMVKRHTQPQKLAAQPSFSYSFLPIPHSVLGSVASENGPSHWKIGWLLKRTKGKRERTWNQLLDCGIVVPGSPSNQKMQPQKKQASLGFPRVPYFTQSWLTPSPWLNVAHIHRPRASACMVAQIPELRQSRKSIPWRHRGIDFSIS